MIYYFKKDNSTTKIQKKKKRKKSIYAIYGESARAKPMCQKWFAKFCKKKKKNPSLDHAPQSSRPVEVDCNQIETWIENNQHSTTQEMADIVQISSVKHHLHQFDVWASHKLSEKKPS